MIYCFITNKNFKEIELFADGERLRGAIPVLINESDVGYATEILEYGIKKFLEKQKNISE